MLKNYLIVAFRNLIRSKGYSLINIGGLAIGLACCIAIGLYIWDECSYDRFHTNYKNIYRVVGQQNQAGAWYNVAVTPGPLAPVLKSEFPEVKQTCRTRQAWWSDVIRVGEQTFEPEQVLTTDNSFFSMFDFKLIKGNAANVLTQPDEIVLSERMTEKIFGPKWKSSGKVLGTLITLRNGRVLNVTGIAQDPPVNSHIQFDALTSCRDDELNSSDYKWISNSYHNYVLLDEEADVEAFNKKILHEMDKHPSGSVNVTLSLQPLSDIYLHSNFDFDTDWSKRSSITYVRIFMAVGTAVLLIALFNFINLSTARAVNRAKEVGVRKVIGALRGQLVSQFLGEAIIMTFLAVVFAIAILQLFIPLLNNVAGKSLELPFESIFFALALVGFMIVVSLLAGIYPAFYLSRFKPVKVLKGSVAGHSGQFFRQSLVVIQFTFSVILIIGTIVIYNQLTFLQNKNLGFDKSRLLWVQMKGDVRAKVSLMKTDLESQTCIAGVSSTSSNLIDNYNSTIDFRWEGQQNDDQFLIAHLNVDTDFLTTTGMTLAAGRNFDPAITSDTSSAYLINETAAKRMGWTAEQAIGKKVTFWTDYEGIIIGVVKDFHFRPMTAAIEPCLFRYWPKQKNSALFVKAKANRITETIALIEKLCKKYDPKMTPYYQFVDEGLEHQYRTEQNTARIVMYFSILAILVSCLGLFGLATYTAEQRTKEIGVRKVLGASVSSIVNLLSADFLKLVMIAIVIASPVAWWGTKQWLNDFAYKISIEWWMFVAAGVAVTAIALLTVSFQSIRAAMMDPVKSLRSE